MINVVCDLDGVIYRGDRAVGGSGPALQRLIEAGARLTFVTNNSTRTPEDSAAKLHRVAGVEVDPGRIATSSLAAASMLTEADQPVLVVGETGTRAALEARRLSVSEDPDEARAVVVGMDRGLTYSIITTAADAVRNGARFIATNTDPTYPIPSGFLPGAGAVVAAIATAGGREPEVAGKPHPPMLELVRSLGVGAPAWVIGDRMDTDIAMAADVPGWSSILVLTGVTKADDDINGADHVVADFAAATDLVLSAEMPRYSDRHGPERESDRRTGVGVGEVAAARPRRPSRAGRRARRPTRPDPGHPGVGVRDIRRHVITTPMTRPDHRQRQWTEHLAWAGVTTRSFDLEVVA